MLVEEKDPDANKEYWIDFEDAFVQQEVRGLYFPLGSVLKYPRAGWYYEVTTPGQLGTNYPAEMPREAGLTVTDGSAVLTCRHPDDVSLGSISSVTWTPASGLTEASSRTSRFLAFVTLSGGDDGTDYDVLCRMVPSIGNAVEKTFTVPVRAQ